MDRKGTFGPAVIVSLSWLTLGWGHALAAQAAPSLQVSPFGYQVTQVQAVPGPSRTYDVTSRVGITNTGDPARDVVATLTSGSAAFVVMDGDVQVGNVPHTTLLPYRSADTFTIRVTVPRIMNLRDLLRFVGDLHRGLSWRITCANCGQANRPPVANAGADQSVYVQQIVTLDGSASSDPDGDALTYQWTLLQRPAGSTATLATPTSVHPALTPDREGEYLVQLIVRDGNLASAPDTVTISTRNSAPVANAGPDQTVALGLPVQLDGSASSDVDGDALTYAWQLVQRPAGSFATLERPDEVAPAFTPDLAGQYVIELVVDDGTVSSPPDTVVISTANSRPIASAGSDQTAPVGASVVFDGSTSSDPDGDPLTYRWSLNARPTGSASALQGATTSSPTLPIDRAGIYVAQLIVNDGRADSEADTVSVSTQNSAPLAVIDGPSSLHFGGTVPLSGVRSSDPDGDPLGFNWSLLSAPQDSVAALSDPFAIAPSFLADRPGIYVAQLIVGDGTLNSAPVSLSIVAQNQSPVAVDDVAVTAVSTAVTIDVLANDHDPDPEDALRIEAAGPAAHGTVSHTATTVTYTPAAGYVGEDSLAYRTTDGAATGTGTLRITVLGAANRPPTADAGADQSVPGGTTVTLDGSLSSDPDADPISYVWEFVARPVGSTALLQNPNSVSPTFVADRRGVFEVLLTVDDGHAATATDTVSISSQNRDPVAQPDTATTPADAPVTIDVLANDSDADGDALTIVGVTQPAAGLAQIVGSGVRYTPAGSGGTEVFSYSIDDGHGGRASGEVTVTISAALPTLAIDDISASEGDEGTGTESFLVRLSVESPSPVSVQFSTVAGTAIAPDDFIARSGTLTIPTGATSGEIEVTIVGDTLHENNESFRVVLSNPQNATLEDSEGEAVIVDDDAGGPTIFELIDAALAAGSIDPETALLYKVYAEFADSRLPAAYQGAEPPGWEGHAIREASARYATLSPATQALIAPFLEFPDPPTAPDAAPEAASGPATGAREAARMGASRPIAPVINDIFTNYVSFELVPGKVRIGWDGDSPLADALEQQAHALETEFHARIWPRLTEAFGPLGSTSRIIILLSDQAGPSFEDATADCTTARIWLRRYDRYTFTHELAHALIDMNFEIAACNIVEKYWMHEATSTWAQHYVYRPTNEGREQDTAPWLLGHPERSFNTHDYSGRSPAYGAYLWFLRLAGRNSDPGLMRQVWSATGGSLEAMDAILRNSGRGGFEKDWPLFAADNWNRHAPHRKYYEWDRMNHKTPETVTNAQLAGNGWEQIVFNFDLPILSAKYHRMNFETDENVRTILFMNNSPDRSDKARVHAIVKVRGQDWKEAEDWTKVGERGYCRDREDEDIEEIVFVFTNVDHQNDGPRVQDQGDYSLIYSGLPCDDWVGHTTYQVESRSGGAVEISTAVGSGLKFRADPETNRAVWMAYEGTVSYQMDATSPFEDGTCTSHAATTLGANGAAQIVLLPSDDGLDFLGTYIAVLPVPPTLQVTTTCSSSSGTFTFTQDQPWFGAAWFQTGIDLQRVAPNPTTLSGEYSDTVGNSESRWTWEFTRADP